MRNLKSDNACVLGGYYFNTTVINNAVYEVERSKRRLFYDWPDEFVYVVCSSRSPAQVFPFVSSDDGTL